MKHILTTLAFLAALCIAAPAEQLIPAKDIVKGLNPGTRSAKSEKRTLPFSPDAFQQLNPGVDAGSRGIIVVATQTQTQATVNVDPSASVSFDNIRFKLNSVELADTTSARQLMLIVEALKEIGREQAFVIEGHTCSLGEESHNQNLSERRAVAVGLFFRRQGVKCDLVPFGLGEREPANANATEAERQANRRVVVRRKA